MKPLICIPMGDPAGIGPEIAVEAILSPELKDKARMVIVGDEQVLRRAAACRKLSPVFNRIQPDLSDSASIQDGACNFIQAGAMDMSAFKYGEISAKCGQVAYECIVASVELAKAGRVDAVATTPINKESLKAAKIDFIGHTEILASLTNTENPLTMFQVFDLRIFFLTRHMSLAAACKAITAERVYENIKLCSAALERLGVSKPKIAVAGLNPHCGEHGLFGDEEDREITPGIERAKAEGYNVHGPKPADSVFHFALKGAWDCVISLYHDQGHIASKMVDFERTIALTHGMPFLRTSVDHGTAFDIAGTGKASAVSMVEAIRLAALYAPAFRRSMA